MEDERAYGKTERDKKVQRFKADFNNIQFTPASQPFLKLFTFHACVNADELLSKKDSEASKRLLSVLEKIGEEIGFSTDSPSQPQFSYAGHMKEIGVRTNYVTGTRLRTHVARIMGEKLGQKEMIQVINTLMITVQSVVKEIEQVMGYTSFNEAKLLSEYKKLEALSEKVEKELAKELPDLEDASEKLMSGLQELKRFHKAIFLRMFGPDRLLMLQDEIAKDAVLDKVVPKILARFANVPLLSKFPAPQRPLPIAQPVPVAQAIVPAINVASNDIDSSIPMEAAAPIDMNTIPVARIPEGASVASDAPSDADAPVLPNVEEGLVTSEGSAA